MAFINLLEIVYPIGSLYFSTSSISPAEVVGGQWEQISDSFYPEYLKSDSDWVRNWLSDSKASRTKMVNGAVFHYGESSGNFSIPADTYTPFTTLDEYHRSKYQIPFVCHQMGGGYGEQSNYVRPYNYSQVDSQKGQIMLYRRNGNDDFYGGYSVAYPANIDGVNRTYIWKRVA